MPKHSAGSPRRSTSTIFWPNAIRAPGGKSHQHTGSRRSHGPQSDLTHDLSSLDAITDPVRGHEPAGGVGENDMMGAFAQELDRLRASSVRISAIREFE
jgi:hypothetical protein